MDHFNFAQGVTGRQCGEVLLRRASIALEQLNRALEEEIERVRGCSLDKDVLSRCVGLVGQLRGDRLKRLIGYVAQEMGEA